MTEIINKIVQVLFECWIYDVEIFKNSWFYWPLCIPAMFYTAFFFVKWAVLTAPVWLPISFMLGGLRIILKK